MFGSKPAMPQGGILSYEAAVAKYESIIPIRGRAVDTRPLGSRRVDSLTIRREVGDSIAIRLYSTDIIVYNPDGTIELKPYASNLTSEVVGAVLAGSRVLAQYTHPLGPILWVRSRGYCIWGCAVLSRDFELVGGSTPFTDYHVDRTKAKQAREVSGYNQFALWFKTLIRLGQDPRDVTSWATSLPYGWGQMLRTPESYRELAAGLSARVSANASLELLRHKVYEHHDCIVETELPFVGGYAQLQGITSHQRVWG